jgi:ribosomal protein S18 acetylase RimI-like enzyme
MADPPRRIGPRTGHDRTARKPARSCTGCSLINGWRNADDNATHEESSMATSDYQIRKASEKDSDAILGCLHTAFEPYRTQYTPQGFADTVLDFETIRRRMYDMCILVAVSGGRIVGTIGCAVKGREGHLRGMAVSPEWQGTGVAAALLHAAETELQNNGCRCVTLDTTAPLKRATRFYEKHGFSATGRVSDFLGMPLCEYSKALSGSRRGG